MNLWKIIDTIITLPAWIAGYMYYAYKSTFLYGGECYSKMSVNTGGNNDV